MKNIALLGSTGSIGKNVLEVVRSHPGRFRVVGMSVGSSVELLREQMEAFDPLLVSVADEEAARRLKEMLPPERAARVVPGPDGARRVAAMDEAEMTVSAMVGGAGLLPTLAAIDAGKDVALAAPRTPVGDGFVLRAVDDIWVRIEDREGNTLYSGMMKKGDTYTVPSQEGLTIIARDGGLLEWMLNGKVMGTLTKPGKVLVGEPLDPERLKRQAG
jgi:1-deoxy-D-xylulose 5-phosphate reductoisomerase